MRHDPEQSCLAFPVRCRLFMNPVTEKLKARTFDFALEIIRFCRTLRKTWEGRELADQLFRAGTRVGANYRAACRGRSRADFIVKLGHVVEEADESCYWLELVKAAEIVDSNELASLLREAHELSAIFNQSQLTAKLNVSATRDSHGPPSSRPSHPYSGKFVNS